MELSTLEQHTMLAIIALGSNAYGVAIVDQINRQTGREPSIGGVYAALDRLEKRGFAKSKHGEATAERGGRRKLYFSVTASGEKALREERRALDASWQGALA